MKIFAINGGPRKNSNTSTMLTHFINGVKSINNEIEVEIVHLYDLKFSPCLSCFSCKLKNGRSYGKCVLKDNISDILINISLSDGVVFASPIYFGEVTGYLRIFIERLLFPFNSYEKDFKKIAPKRIKTAFLYTMNVSEEKMKLDKYDVILAYLERCIERVYTKPETAYAFNTYQFLDYSKYEAEAWNEVEKLSIRNTQFPIDCQNSFDIGCKIARGIVSG